MKAATIPIAVAKNVKEAVAFPIATAENDRFPPKQSYTQNETKIPGNPNS
jgi:hypothetical protein